MHAYPTPRQRRSASIVLGATLAAATLVACGDEQPADPARQLRAADDVYRTTTAPAAHQAVIHSAAMWPRVPLSAPVTDSAAENGTTRSTAGSSATDSQAHGSGTSEHDGSPGVHETGAHETVASHDGESSHSVRGGFGGGFHGFSHGS